MNWNIFLVTILVGLLIIPSVFAITTDLKESYKPRETIIFKIEGNILENIEKEQIDFLRGHVSVPLEFGLEKIQGDYYVWAIAPENNGTYGFVINELITTDKGKIVEIDFEQNFSVQGEIIDYNVKPGVIFTGKDFSLNVYSFIDNELEIPILYVGQGNVKLNPGENKIDFSVKDIKKNELIIIGVGNYAFPAYIIGENSANGEINRLPEFRFKPRTIKSTIINEGKTIVYPIQIINSGEEKISILFDYDKDIFLIPKNEVTIQSNEIYEFNATLKKFPSENLNEIIYAKSGNFSIELPVVIEITNSIDEANTDFSETELYYCSELNGKQCTANEICDGDLEQSLDGACCVGVCKEEDTGGSYTWIGWILAGIVVLIIAIVFVKYRKTKVSGDKKFNERIKSAERNTRMP